MPKSVDPKSIIRISGGSTTATQVVNNLSSQVTIREGAYRASEITTENPLGIYLGNDVQSHFNELTGTIQNPPRVGQGSVSFTNASGVTTSHSGYPDWGVLKQADNPVWERQDTISYDGTFADTSLITLAPEDVFFYNRATSFAPVGVGTPPDPIFNTEVSFGLIGHGAGATFLASKEGQAFDPNSGAPLSERDLPIRMATYLSFLNNSSGGFTISGLLFPADRGTIALLHWTEEGFNLSPAGSVADIQKRVVAAINLDGGIQGDSPYIDRCDMPFPCRQAGQYDLSEMQTGLYRQGTSLGGMAIPNPPFTPSRTIGAVRLLKDENAAYFGDGVSVVDERGHLPVLFGSYYWDGFSWALEPNNFMAYRLPMRADYSPSGLFTPREYRERFFQVIQPASTFDPFETAGNYVTFGEDHCTHQVARYRYSARYDSLIGISQDVDGSIFAGSFALVHFKTEDAFEKLVRDGIAPSEDDLWSVSLFNYDEGEADRNVAQPSSSYSETGEIIESPVSINADSLPVVRPSILISAQNADRFAPQLREDGVTPNDYSKTIIPSDTATGGVFKRDEGYYTTISGVKYILPRFHRTDLTIGDWTLPYSNVRMTAIPPHTELNEAFYSDINGVFNYDYNVPFDPMMINLSALTGDANLQAHFNNASTGDSGTILGRNQRIEIATGQLDTTTLEIQPKGDTGLAVISEGVWTSAIVRDPLYHYDGFPISKVFSATPEEGSEEVLSTRMLYHSSRLLSLVENTYTSEWALYVGYSASARTNGCRFSIFRYDEEGIKVYLPFDLPETSNLELLSSATRGLYQPYYASNVAFQSDTPDAYIYPSAGVKYYIEIKTRPNTSAGDFYLALVPPFYESFRGTEPTFSNFVTQVTIDMYDPNVGLQVVVPGLTTKLLEFEVLFADSTANVDGVDYDVYASESYSDILNGSAVDSPDHPYPDLGDLGTEVGRYINEVYPITGSDAPTYGNFTEDEFGVISVQGMSDPTNSTMTIKAWADSTQPLRRKPLSTLFTARKDTQERFLDESYRIESTFDGFNEVTRNERGWDNTLGDRLAGISYDGAPIDFFVRDDSDTSLDVDSNHSRAGYLRNGRHWNKPATGLQVGEAQVRGLPPMQDAILSFSKYGQPRRGMLGLHDIDYTTSSYFPNGLHNSTWEDNDTTIPKRYFEQPSDAQFLEGGQLAYLRAFDLAFSRSGATEDVIGDKSFKFRVYGVSFHEHIHSIEEGIPLRVVARMPGLTEWFDCGMTKGYTAPNSDQTGCLVGAREGFSVEEGVYFTELEVGFDKGLFVNSEGEVTVLILVRIIVNDASRALDFGRSSTSTPIRDRRGVVGLEVLRKSTGQNFDGDDVVYTKDIDVFGVLPTTTISQIQDGVEVNQNFYNLAFSLETGGNIATSQEFMQLFPQRVLTLSEGFGFKRAELTAGGYDAFVNIVNRTEPYEVRVYSNDLIASNNGWLGYFEDVPPGDYTLYVESQLDENTNPEMNAAFLSILGVPTPSTIPVSSTKTNLLEGVNSGSRAYFWDLNINSTGLITPISNGSVALLANLTDVSHTLLTIANTGGEVQFFIQDLTSGGLVALSVGTSPYWTVKQDVATLDAGTDYSDADGGTTSVTFDLEVGKNYKFVYQSLTYGNSLQVALGFAGTGYSYSEVLTASAPHRYEHYCFVNRVGQPIYEYIADPVS